MTKPCSRVLNESVTKFGLEMDDFLLLGVMAAVLLFLLPALGWLLVTPALIYGVYKAKKGKPRGALLHTLHSLCLVPGTGLLSPWPQTYSPWEERGMAFRMDHLVRAVEDDEGRVQLGSRLLGLGVGGVAIGLVLSVILLVKTLLPAPAYITPPLGAGLVYPGYIDDLTAYDTAKEIFQARWTWSAADHKRMGEQVKLLLDPSLHKDLDDAMKREAALIREKKLSTAAVSVTERILERKQDAVLVRVDGTRTLSVDGLALDPEPVSMSMVLRPALKRGAKQGVRVTQFAPGPRLTLEGSK